MPQQICNKCRGPPAAEGDTWCLGCSAWESLGRELCGSWGAAGARLLANDLVITAAQQTRALRSLAAGLLRADGASRSAGRAEAAPLGRLTAGRAYPREGQRRKEEQESEEEEDEESDEEEDRRSKRKRSRSPPRREGGGDRRPPEPDGPPPPGTTPLGRRLSRADTDRTAGHTKRHHDRGHRGHRSTKGHNKPKRRGGRKHKRLARLAADPTKVLGPVPARPVKMARFVEGAEYGLLDKEAWSAIFPRPGMVLEVQMKGTDISVLEEEWAASS